MTLARDIRKLFAWRERSARAFEERMRELHDYPVRKIKPKKRSPSEFSRIYGSVERVRAIKALPCCVPGCLTRPSENAHLGNGGTGRKSDACHVVPLCRHHHRMLDDVLGSVEAFDAEYRTDLHARAAKLARECGADG